MILFFFSHSYRCHFTKNMTQRTPTRFIRRPLDYGTGSADGTDFIKCIDGQESQIHEFWCLGLDRIIRKVHPTVQVEVNSRTVGDFVTNYLAENGRRIKIIGQLYTNDSVQFLGFPVQSCGTVMPFIYTLQAPCELIGWGIANNYNQKWGGNIFDSNSIRNVACGASIHSRSDYFSRSPVNPRSARRRVHNNFLCRRHQYRLRHN